VADDGDEARVGEQRVQEPEPHEVRWRFLDEHGLGEIPVGLPRVEEHRAVLGADER
jgi:hypothetical protein